jgi:hypothetical protein
MEVSHFELPVELWVKSLYDFSIAYKNRNGGFSSAEIIEALVPIYYAKIASFVNKTQNLDTSLAEETINQQCAVFEGLKPYLVDAWTSQA